jgi:hypothetical protein
VPPDRVLPDIFRLLQRLLLLLVLLPHMLLFRRLLPRLLLLLVLRLLLHLLLLLFLLPHTLLFFPLLLLFLPLLLLLLLLVLQLLLCRLFPLFRGLCLRLLACRTRTLPSLPPPSHQLFNRVPVTALRLLISQVTLHHRCHLISLTSVFLIPPLLCPRMRLKAPCDPLHV